jgi:protein-disulfide isomerase
MKQKDLFVNVATFVATLCTVVVTSIVVYRQFIPVPIAAGPAPVRVDRMIPDWRQQEALGRRIGPATSALTVLEYADFECPACLGFFREIEKVRSAHPQDISIAFRHFPLRYHKQAYPSARAAECAAAQGAFEEMYKMLYTSHDSLGQVPYRELAKRAAVPDLTRFDACFADTSRVPRVEADLKAAEATQIPGTPGVIIDGKLWQTRMPRSEDLEKLIKEHRKSN